jgi:hypothetical protein
VNGRELASGVRLLPSGRHLRTEAEIFADVSAQMDADDGVRPVRVKRPRKTLREWLRRR